MDTPKNPYKNTSGKRYTRELFYETTLSDKTNVLYTLKNQDHEGYPSLYRLYMEKEDLTEFLFAKEYLDGYDHFELLCASSFFAPYIRRWRKELSLKLEAQILQNFITIGKSGGEGAFQANKIVLDRIRKPVHASKRGRPSQDEVDAHKLHQIALEREIEEDLKRLKENPQ